MKFIAVAIIILIALAGAVLSEKARFDNYRVYSVYINKSHDFELLQQLEQQYEGYQIWNRPALGQNADILVPPHKLADFTEILEKLNLMASVKIENVQQLIDDEQPKGSAKAEFGWEAYQGLGDIYAWLDEQLVKYKSVLSAETVGYSHHGTEMRAVRLSHKPGNPAILIEANIHAREWITSATATWVLNELLTSKDPAVRDIAENIDWYIIPVANPDGFNYTKSSNRMWRKTRYPHFHLCYGVDGNRNFDFQWMHVGASQDPCSETYAGPKPFSEPETRALADFYIKHKNQVKVYLAFHSYSQYILMPFGYTHNKVENYDQQKQVGTAAAEAIRKWYGTDYKVGSTAELLYMNSGSSRDWVRGVHNINISYTIEFRDKGSYGFILPPEQIIPNSQEIFDALKAIVGECRKIGYL